MGMRGLSFPILGLVAAGYSVIATPLCLHGAEMTEERPNIIVILADDLGYGQLGCYGNPERLSPELDRMAREGMRFTDFHSSGAVSSPTRAGFLTGRYQQRGGINTALWGHFELDRHLGLDSRETTFAELLHDAGYTTGLIGKWHLGWRPEFHPLNHGFDRFHGYLSGAVCYQSHYQMTTSYYDWWEGREQIEEPGYSARLITKNALQFIKQADNRPFCLYIAQQAVHSPYQGPNDPPLRGPNAQRILNDKTRDLRAYREMILELDRSVGEILGYLRKTGFDKKTIVFFLSDNGPEGPGISGVLHGTKASLWEGVHRVPAIAWWPAKIRAGSISTELTSSLDLFSTLLELARVKQPAGLSIDGRSLMPLFLGKANFGRRQLFWSHPVAFKLDANYENYAMRDDPWKLLITAVDSSEQITLYNLDEDLGEQHDLSAKYPERVQSMRKAVRQWRIEMANGATPIPDRPQSQWGPEFLPVWPKPVSK